jgi:hypothetical protein
MMRLYALGLFDDLSSRITNLRMNIIHAFAMEICFRVIGHHLLCPSEAEIATHLYCLPPCVCFRNVVCGPHIPPRHCGTSSFSASLCNFLSNFWIYISMPQCLVVFQVGAMKLYLVEAMHLKLVEAMHLKLVEAMHLKLVEAMHLYIVEAIVLLDLMFTVEHW